MKIQNLIIPALAIAFTAVVIGQDQSEPKPRQFVGTKRCAMCHKGEKNGNIFEKWEATAHSQAFTTLGSDKAREVYAKLGKSGNPQTDAACLKCHTTSQAADSALKVNLTPNEGISCEACHGPGGDYWKKTIMMDKKLALENGLTAEPQKGCVACHNQESPTYKEFKFEEYYPKIEHQLPPKP